MARPDGSDRVVDGPAAARRRRWPVAILASLLVPCAAALVLYSQEGLQDTLYQWIRGTAIDTQLRLLEHRIIGLMKPGDRCDASGLALERHNVVLVTVDTLRADRMGFHGYPRDVSPHLDALAADSLVFERAYSTAPWTTPSFAAVFTGLHPGALGIDDDPRPPPDEVETLSQALCGAGYRTMGVVSHSYVGARYGFARGFEAWDEANAGGHAYVSSPKVTERAIRYLDSALEDPRPFFLFVHYFDPHHDYTEHDEFPYAAGYQGRVRSAKDNITELRSQIRSGELQEDDLEYLRDAYDSEIAFTDRHIGRLLDALRERRVYEDALIVFLSDHGEMFAGRSHRWLGHSKYLYDELIHVPLLFKLPRQRRVGVQSAPVSTVDVFPTILDVLGHPAPPSGGDRSRSLLRRSSPSEHPVFAQTRQQNAMDAVLRGEWKLIRDWNAETSQLFRMRGDRGDFVDVGEQHPEVVAELEGLLATWLSGLEAQGLEKAAVPDLSDEERERLRGLGYIAE